MHFTDPFGLSPFDWLPWRNGGEFADWADERNEYARRWWQGNPENWIWNGSVNTGSDLVSACTDLFRVGEGTGYALFANDENGYGRAAFVAMDITRASGLFTLLAGAPARGPELSFGKDFRFAPFGNRTGHKYGEWPHYHRRGRDATGNTKPGQGIGRHRPWERKSTDKRIRDRF